MELTVSHSCPQCGAAIEFSETAHFLICPYCGVRNFMFSARYFRFLFETRIAGDGVVFVPYLNFRGNAFFCRGLEIDQKNLNLTALGLASRVLPPNLGFKTQTHKVKLLDGGIAGSFLRFDLRIDDMLSAAIGTATGARTFNHMFIGEALSLLYFPLVVQGRALVDGITGDEVAVVPPGFDFGDHALDAAPASDLAFLGALCPQCGAELDGEGHSRVLTCANCDSAWEPVDGRFVQRAVAMVEAPDRDHVFLPFWRMSIRSTDGPAFDTHGAFGQLTGQPTLRRGPADRPMLFYSPAFKIAPQTFLRLCARLTIAQREFRTTDALPRAHRHPITLASKEAGETVPLTVAELAFNKHDVFPVLPSLRAEVTELSLLYLPFQPAGVEMIQEDLRLGVSASALDFARYLS